MTTQLPTRTDGNPTVTGDPEIPLEARGVSMHFGGTVALSDVSFSVQPSEHVGLIGPNGAGKTTLLGAVSGLLRPTSGTVLRRGRNVTKTPAERRARGGLGRTFQHSSRFTALTAAESIAVAILAHREDHPFLRSIVSRGRPQSEAMSEARALMAELGVDAFADAAAGDLPLGIARLIDVARAIAGQPDLLLLDEPSSGLDHQERDHLRSFIRNHVAARGTAFVLVEHDVEFVQSLCDRIVVLDFGSKIADGPTAQVLSDPAVKAAYLGQDAGPEAGAAGATVQLVEPTPVPAVSSAESTSVTATGGDEPVGDVALELRQVTAGYERSLAIDGLDVRVRRGRALAVLGPNGSGKTTLARVISGQLRPVSGSVLLNGRDVTGSPSATMARHGVFHVPDSRAIYPSLTARENLRMAFRHHVPKRELDERIAQVVEFFPALARHMSTRAGTLSGGEQQMLALAPAIVVPPEILVVDELSHGLSPLVVGQMFDILVRLKNRVTIVVIEQFTDRALDLADDVIALRNGTVVFNGLASAVTEEDVMAWYALDHA